MAGTEVIVLIVSVIPVDQFEKVYFRKQFPKGLKAQGRMVISLSKNKLSTYLKNCKIRV